MVGTSTGTACDGSWGQWERRGKGFKAGAVHVDRRYFCPLMDCAIDRGGIMSKRYSRCLSAKLGALCPPMPVFKYAMLTPGPRRQKREWGGRGGGAGVRRGSSIFLTAPPGDHPRYDLGRPGGVDLEVGRGHQRLCASVQT